MSAFRIYEIERTKTPLGELVLRKRYDRVLARIVTEVLLADEFLMSNAFVEAEVALADLALSMHDGAHLKVVVGGLGLGFTAAAALRHSRVESVLVIEALEQVIDWHQQGEYREYDARAPVATNPSDSNEQAFHTPIDTADARCRFALGDFFARVDRGALDETDVQRKADVILLDIDHSPKETLHASNARFYREEGLRRCRDQLEEGGVFGLWSNDPPDGDFEHTLKAVFDEVQVHQVAFDNPYSGSKSANSIYLAQANAKT